jgi:hypothetical protein
MFPKYKYPIEYELTPKEIQTETNWVTLKLKNIGNETLKDLDVQLHSLDTYNLTVHGSWWEGAGHHINDLGPNETNEVVFRVNAIGPADVYATLKGRKDKNPFWWESSLTRINVSDEKAYLERLVVLSNPYTTIGKTISTEATVKGLTKTGGLKLEFWVETPSGKNEMQAKIDIKDLPVGEEARYTTEFTPTETGRYDVYVYLYDGWKRIDHKMAYVYAVKQ